jgi:hypothetical protein
MSNRRENRRAAAHQRAAARSGRMTAEQAMRPAVGGRSKISYQGSATGGYGSDWSRAAHVGGADKPLIIDARWSDTVTNPGSHPLVRK